MMLWAKMCQSPMCPNAHVPHCPCAPLPMCPITPVPHLDLIGIGNIHWTHDPAHVHHVPMLQVKCQKDVKLSKRCQVVKKMSNIKKSNTWTMEEVHKKINWHNEVHRYWCQFWRHKWWSLKTLKMFIESIFGQFWWPSYLMSKLTSICVNLIMSIYFFVNLLHSPDVWLFDIWHLFDNLTSFWQLDTWLITWAHGEHVQDHVFNEYCQYLLDPDGGQGWWGTWAMGPMGDWHILAYNIITTGWILTKIFTHST